MNKEIEFIVPSEAIPALIGYKGQKHQDTEERTKTKIKFSKNCEVTSKVNIIGSMQNCRIAEGILKLAARHCLASLKTMEPYQGVLRQENAVYDVKTLLFEIDKNKSS